MFRSGQDALPNVRVWLKGLPDVRECSKAHHECPGVVERLSWMSRSGRKTLPDVREWSDGPAKFPGVVGGPPGCPGGLLDVREWSIVHHECSEVVGRPSRMSRRPSRMSRSVRKALSNVRESHSVDREWSETLPVVREWSGGPHACSGVFGRPSRKSRSG